MTDDAPPELLTAREVARLFRVDAKTVRQWKKLTVIRTPTKHMRYLKDEVYGFLDQPTSSEG